MLFDLLRRGLPGKLPPVTGPIGIDPHPRSALLGPDEDDRQLLAEAAAGRARTAADTGPTPTQGRPHSGEPGSYDAGGADPELAQAPSPPPKSSLPYPTAHLWPRRRPDEPYPQPSPDVARTIGPRVVAVPQKGGSFEVRDGGTKTWRNNNPGALKYLGDQTARDSGALGVDDDGFAIFPSYGVGKAAAMESLRKKTGTLDGAIAAWAPKNEDDTAAYQRFIQSQVGLPGDARMDSLTPQQMDRLYEAIKRYEGWKEGVTAHGRRLD